MPKNPLDALPESVRLALLAVIAAGRRWEDTDIGTRVHEWLVEGAEHRKNGVELYAEILRDHDVALEGAVVDAESAASRAREREKIELVYGQVKRSAEAYALALTLIEKVGRPASSGSD
jgi:hypothetical protein